MKEATGEANLSVITILLIGTILSFFYMVIPRIMNGIKDKACCVSNNGTIMGNSCVITSTKIKAGTKYEDGVTHYQLKYFNNHCK